MRRKRALWAMTLLLLLPIGGEAWWRLTEPSDWVETVGSLNAEEILARDILSDPTWRQRVGYTSAQSAEGQRRRIRSDFLFYASTESLSGLLPPMLPDRFQIAEERFFGDRVRDGIDRIVGERAALTVDQRRVLRGEAARREGPFLMTDPGIGTLVGLTPAQQKDVWDRDSELRRNVQRGHHEADEELMGIEGAPASAIEAHRALFRLLESPLDSEDDETLRRRAKKVQELSERSSYSHSLTVPMWLRERRRSLTYRRLWAHRREAEASLLASLKPAQRDRWNALTRG